jgi:hypothetical protein
MSDEFKNINLCDSQKAKWTLFFYLSEEDTYAMSPFFYSLNKSTQNFSYSNLNICIFHKSNNYYGSHKIMIKGTEKGPIIKTLKIDDNFEFLDGNILFNFIKETSELCPSENTALFIQTHSNGWYAKESLKNPKIQTYPVLFSKLLKEQIKFDIIGLNTCYISTLEIMYELRNLTKYVIACEMSSPIIPMWGATMFYAFSNIDDIKEIGFQICSDFINMNNNVPQNIIENTEKYSEMVHIKKIFEIPTDVSFIDVSQINNLLNYILNNYDLSKISDKGKELATVNPPIANNIKYKNVFYIKDLYSAIKYGFPNSNKDDIKKFSFFESLFKKTVVYYLQTKNLQKSDWSKYLNGLSYIYCPYKNTKNGYTYRELEIYKFSDKLISCDI